MKKLVLLTTVTAGLNLALMSAANGATYAGDATGATVTVTATGTTIRAATNSLPISGGEADAALSVGDIPGSATGGVVTLAASALSSVVIGTGADTRAHAAMGAVGLTVSGNQISSDFLMARSTASCGPSIAGRSELVNLVINGQPITVTGAANQTVTLSNGSVVINEQVPTVGGTSGELVVNALHVFTHDTVTGQPIADVTLGNADAKIDCAAGSSPGQNWVTGSGWIPGHAGGKATFGFVAGPGGGGSTRGHLTLKDHSTGATIHGTVINNFTECLSGQSEFQGTDTNSRQFAVNADDNGDPGTLDTFQVDGFDQNGAAYSNGPPPSFLGGGNIQTHGFLCP
jgi:hypothetical protein